MKAFFGLVEVLSVPLVILNLLGGIVSLIWLLILGEWRLVLLGLLIVLAGSFLLMIAFLPSAILGAPAMYFASREKFLAANVFMLPSILYTNAVVAVWCSALLVVFTRDAVLSDLVPRMIWSYGIATGALSYMASKESGGGDAPIGPTISVFFAEIGFLFVMLRVIFSSSATFQSVWATFAGFMIVAVIVQACVSFVLFRDKRDEAIDLEL